MILEELSDNNFNTTVLQSTGIVIVVFGATWCAPCKVLEPLVNKLSDEAGCAAFKVDIDECENVVKSFKIKSAPTTLIFKNGAFITSRTGSMTYAELKNMHDAIK